MKAILPHDWLISRLGLHGKFMSGSAFPDQFQGRCNEEIPFYKVADLARSSDGVHMPEPMHTISDETRKRLKAKLIPKGSIVYAKIGAASLLNRRRVTTRSCCIDNNMTAFVPEQVSPEWALIWLRSLDFGAYMCPATVPSISEGIQADLPLGLPPMEYEQRSIALLNERLPKIDKLITLLEDKSSALSSYRQSLITRAVTKGLDPNVEMKDSGVEWIGDIPKHWQISTLGRIGTFKGGDAFPVNLQGRSDNEISFYKVANLGIHKESIYLKKSENTIAKEDAIALKANIINPGSIVYAKIGAALLLNRRRIVNEPCCIDNNMTAFTLRTGNLLWAYYFLSTIDFGMYTCPATVPSLSEGRQSQIPIAIPPMNEQIEIGEYISSRLEKFQELYDSIIEMINNMKEYRSSLISAAVTGQLAIEEAEE